MRLTFLSFSMATAFVVVYATTIGFSCGGSGSGTPTPTPTGCSTDGVGTGAAGSAGGSGSGGSAGTGGVPGAGFPTQACIDKANALLAMMTLDEKAGQTIQAERAQITNAQVTQYAVGSIYS